MSWIALVRHGQTEWNAQRRLQGLSDLPLSAEGQQQARTAVELLRHAPIAGVLSSPLARAHETATILAHELGTSVPVVDERLLERDYGEAEGLTIADADYRWPDAQFPGAESMSDLAERAAHMLRLIVNERPGVAVVGHGAFMRAGISELCQNDFPRILNGQALILRRRPGLWGIGEWQCEPMAAPRRAPSDLQWNENGPRQHQGA